MCKKSLNLQRWNKTNINLNSIFMKKLYLAMAGIAAFLVGCSSEEPTVMTDKNQSKDRNPYTKRSIPMRCMI